MAPIWTNLSVGCVLDHELATGATTPGGFPGLIASMTLGTTKCLVGEPTVNTYFL